MISFIHLAKNVNPSELSWYEDVILDACCQNIASSDDIWHLVVEMSVLLVTCTQQSNPRSPWYTLSDCYIIPFIRSFFIFAKIKDVKKHVTFIIQNSLT